MFPHPPVGHIFFKCDAIALRRHRVPAYRARYGLRMYMHDVSVLLTRGLSHGGIART